MGSEAIVEDRATGRSKPSAAIRVLRWSLVAVPVALLAYAVLLSLPGIGDSGRALARLARPVALITLILEVGAVLTLAMVYRASLWAVGDDIDYRSSLGVSMSAFTISRVVPGGGAVGAVVAARRLTSAGVEPARASAAVVLMGTVAMLTLGVLVTGGAIAATFTAGLPTGYALATGILASILVVVIIGVVAVLRSAAVRRWLLRLGDRWLGRFGFDVAAWHHSMEEIAADPPDLGRIGTISMWSAVNWLLDIGVVWVLFRGFDHPVGLGVVLVGYGVANLGAALPLTPGGLGLVEAGMAGTYTALGVDGATAVVVVLGYRLVSYWLPTLAGVPAYLRGPRHGNEVLHRHEASA